MKGYTKLLICFAFIGTTMAYTNPELLFGDETSTTLNNDGTMDPGDINTFDEDHGHTPKLKGKHIVNEDMMLTDAEERLYFGSNKQNDEADDEEDAKLYDAITDKRYRWDPSKPIPYVVSSKLGMSVDTYKIPVPKQRKLSLMQWRGIERIHVLILERNNHQIKTTYSLINEMVVGAK